MLEANGRVWGTVPLDRIRSLTRKLHTEVDHVLLLFSAWTRRPECRDRTALRVPTEDLIIDGLKHFRAIFHPHRARHRRSSRRGMQRCAFHSDCLVGASLNVFSLPSRPDDGLLYSSYPGRIKSLKAGDSGRRQIPPGLRDDAAADDLPLVALARRGSNTSQKSVQSVQSLGGMDSLNSSTSGTLQGLVRVAQRNFIVRHR